MTVGEHHIAQVNIALPKQPLDTPLLAEFVAALDPVNASADASPGFVWRLQTEDGNATAVRAFDDDRLVVNMSVWASLEALRAFVYPDAGHLAVMRRRRESFARMAESHLALWWIPAGHVPTVAEAEGARAPPARARRHPARVWIPDVVPGAWTIRSRPDRRRPPRAVPERLTAVNPHGPRAIIRRLRGCSSVG